jgi:hypothetical protein
MSVLLPFLVLEVFLTFFEEKEEKEEKQQNLGKI